MNWKNVTVAGSGVLGYQIAMQAAYHGFNVTVYDLADDVLTKAKAKFDNIASRYREDLGATQAQLDAARQRLTYSSDLADAVKDADLMIEAITENPEAKQAFYTALAKVAPEKTVFVTNTSTLLPSQLVEFTGRPPKFLALHFANEIWKNNMAEIMGQPATDPAVFDDVVAFARQIGMVPIPLLKENPGYVINALLVPLLSNAVGLVVQGVADPHTIDKVWMTGLGAPKGPFGTLDMVGITTFYNVSKMIAAQSQDPVKAQIVDYLKENFIDTNKLGEPTGEGFYKHPNPAYLSKDFLK